MNFFSFVPLPALLVLLLLVVIIIISFIILSKRKKPTSLPETSVEPQPLQPLPTTPQQGVPLPNLGPVPSLEPATNVQTMNISTQPVKPNDSKYFLLIIFVALLAIFIPLLAIIMVKNQKSAATQPTPQTVIAACNAITITDTLNNPLSDTDLSTLRPGDEVKILISATGNNLTKARFRVNGSEWQEVSLKDGNNFIGNYILDAVSKFAIEGEVFDKDKGWL